MMILKFVSTDKLKQRRQQLKESMFAMSYSNMHSNSELLNKLMEERTKIDIELRQRDNT